MDCGVCQFLLLLGKVYAELNIKYDSIMNHKYVLMYVSEHSDGHIWVVGGKKVIKHIILTA